MILSKRHLELIAEVHEFFVRHGEWPNRKTFRNAHPPEDLEPLNQLENNFQYLRKEGERYQTRVQLMLASGLCQSEKDIIQKAIDALKPLYPEYGDTTPVPAALIQEKTGLSNSELKRALHYLADGMHVYFHSHPSNGDLISLYESVRLLNTPDDLVDPWALSKWKEDSGQIKKKSLQERVAEASLAIGTVFPPHHSPAPKPSSDSVTWEQLRLDWFPSSDLRKVVVHDYEECRKAFLSEAHKCALVMAGACLEGILLGAITRIHQEDSGIAESIDKELAVLAASRRKGRITLNELEVSRLIQLAIKQRMIKAPQEKLSNVVIEYRNYIHPGKVIRLDEVRFDHLEAQTAINILRLAARDLDEHFARPN